MSRAVYIGFFLIAVLSNCITCFSDDRLTKNCDLNFQKLATCGKIEWVVRPKAVEMVTEKDKSEFTIELSPKKNQSKQTKLNFELNVRLFMPSMGHGSHPTQVVPEYDQLGNRIKGKFRVKNVYFTMPGDWEIQVVLKNNGKTVDKAVYPYFLTK
jgi:hypothetical protein